LWKYVASQRDIFAKKALIRLELLISLLTNYTTAVVDWEMADLDGQDEEEQAISGTGTTGSYPPAPAYSGKAILTYTWDKPWSQTESKMGLFGQSKEVSSCQKVAGGEKLKTV
jgi:hypothetical protein